MWWINTVNKIETIEFTLLLCNCLTCYRFKDSYWNKQWKSISFIDVGLVLIAREVEIDKYMDSFLSRTRSMKLTVENMVVKWYKSLWISEWCGVGSVHKLINVLSSSPTFRFLQKCKLIELGSNPFLLALFLQILSKFSCSVSISIFQVL